MASGVFLQREAIALLPVFVVESGAFGAAFHTFQADGMLV